VLLASVTYFKVEPGDEVTLVVPRDIDSDWGSIENVIQKGRISHANLDYRDLSKDKYLEEDTENISSSVFGSKKSSGSIFDEWAPDLDELKKELNKKDL
jgi:hypothetical protein